MTLQVKWDTEDSKLQMKKPNFTENKLNQSKKNEYDTKITFNIYIIIFKAYIFFFNIIMCLWTFFNLYRTNLNIKFQNKNQ